MNHSLELKIIPVIQVAIIAALMYGVAQVLPLSSTLLANKWLVFSIFIAIGSFFGVAGIVSFYIAKTTVNPEKPEKASTLVTTGIYQFTRNPMYVGLVCFLIAWAAWLGSFYSLVFIVVFILYMNRFQIKPEERALAKLFGQAYQDYCQKVRRWL